MPGFRYKLGVNHTKYNAMDWKAINFDWNQTRAFLVTAREGSFSAAANALELSQPTLSRQVAALEASLNVVLFEKSSRGLVLTPVGEELLMHATRMSEAALDLSLTATGSANDLQGTVCISASEINAGYLLPELVLNIQQKYPAIRIEILAANEVSDLRRREADIAIRALRPKQLDLIAKKIRNQQWGLFASKELVSSTGPLDSMPALEKAKYISFDQSNTLIAHFAKENLHVTEENIVVVAQNMMVGMQLIKLGAGIGVLPIDIGQQQAQLQRVAPDLIEFDVENWLVTHSELRTNRRIRAVYDCLAKALAA